MLGLSTPVIPSQELRSACKTRHYRLIRDPGTGADKVAQFHRFWYAGEELAYFHFAQNRFKGRRDRYAPICTRASSVALMSLISLLTLHTERDIFGEGFTAGCADDEIIFLDNGFIIRITLSRNIVTFCR